MCCVVEIYHILCFYLYSSIALFRAKAGNISLTVNFYLVIGHSPFLSIQSIITFFSKQCPYFVMTGSTMICCEIGHKNDSKRSSSSSTPVPLLKLLDAYVFYYASELKLLEPLEFYLFCLSCFSLKYGLSWLSFSI